MDSIKKGRSMTKPVLLILASDSTMVNSDIYSEKMNAYVEFLCSRIRK